MRNDTILITIYDDPSKFPPTINAITLLAKKYEKVILLWRGSPSIFHTLPENCSDYVVSSPNLIQTNIITKLFVLIKYIFKSIKLAIKYKPRWLVCYDTYSLLAVQVAKRINPRHKIWYHNHDVTDLAYVKKYSITWWCWQNEQNNLKTINLFSVPDISRLKYFNLDEKTKHFILPNYPLKNINYALSKRMSNLYDILYQGRVSDGHGIREMIKFIIERPNLPIRFQIIGSYDEPFQKELISTISKFSLGEKVILHRQMKYDKLQEFTENFHIGLGVLEPLNVAFQTCATASNKIYEYAASGMPVILYDSVHFRTALKAFKWAKFTDLTVNSFEVIMEDIMTNYDMYSERAYKDFCEKLNYENVFSKVLAQLS